MLRTFIIYALISCLTIFILAQARAQQRVEYPPIGAKPTAGTIYQGMKYPPGMAGGGGGGLAIELVIGVNSLPLVS